MYDPRNPNNSIMNSFTAHSVSQMVGDSEIFVAGSGIQATYTRINLTTGNSIATVHGARTNKYSIAGDDKHVRLYLYYKVIQLS